MDVVLLFGWIIAPVSGGTAIWSEKIEGSGKNLV
jgi:hypothetical protein